MEVQRKITVAGINGSNGGFSIAPDAAPFLIARIFGMARKVEVKETTFGPYKRFSGDFRAINQYGEEFAAPVVILPEPADSLLETAMLAEGVDLSAGVQFGFDVFLAPHPKKTPVDRGYKFAVKPLMETAPNDPLKAMAAALPAPEVKARPTAALPPAAAPAESPAAAPVAEPAAAPAAKGKK